MASTETARLLEHAAGGGLDEQDALYRHCAAKLLPLIRLRLGPSLRAQLESRDILQTVMLKAFQKIQTIKEPASLMAWLSRIAQNEIRDQVDYFGRRQRDMARRTPLDEAVEVPAPVRQALSQVILNEQGEELERALEALPDASREVIVLRKLEELTFPEISVRLGRSEDACRMLFARAMTDLTLRLRARD
jgi:RNA polymerase sigma-70 factor (ECF subfamily)